MMCLILEWSYLGGRGKDFLKLSPQIFSISSLPVLFAAYSNKQIDENLKHKITVNSQWYSTNIFNM